MLSLPLVGATSLIVASIGALVARLALLGPGIAAVGALCTDNQGLVTTRRKSSRGILEESLRIGPL